MLIRFTCCMIIFLHSIAATIDKITCTLLLYCCGRHSALWRRAIVFSNPEPIHDITISSLYLHKIKLISVLNLSVDVIPAKVTTIMGPFNCLNQELHSELQQKIDNSEYLLLFSLAQDFHHSLGEGSYFNRSIIKQVFPT